MCIRNPATQRLISRIGASAVLLLAAACGTLRADISAAADTPPTARVVRPGAVWLDTADQRITAHGGCILYHDGVYFWYGEHYGQRGADRSVRVYRSADLIRWENRGEVLRVSPEGDVLRPGCVIERPKVLFNSSTRQFVMWFHLELAGQGYSAADTGTAVSSSPEGPFKLVRYGRGPKEVWPLNFRPTTENPTGRPPCPPNLPLDSFNPSDPKYQRLVNGFRDGQESRDMTVFQDDDRKAYLIYSSEMNDTLHIAELTADYQGFTGRFVRALAGRQREGSAMFKHDGKYYLITSRCTGWKPNAAEVDVADSVWGPWRSLGNPWQGPEQRTKVSFDSQSAFVLSLPNGQELFMADRWMPRSLDTSSYIWEPVQWVGDKPTLSWNDSWSISLLLPTQ